MQGKSNFQCYLRLNKGENVIDDDMKEYLQMIQMILDEMKDKNKNADIDCSKYDFLPLPISIDNIGALGKESSTKRKLLSE
jgi:hypothetical protein